MNLESTIDHTVLKPEATESDIIQCCEEAVKYNFAAVCVNPLYVPLAKKHLADHSVALCTVAGFPLGAVPTKLKMKDAQISIQAGATEIDMVIPVGLLKQGEKDRVFADIRSMSELCHKHQTVLKVIIETCLLTDDEKQLACELVCEGKADFVKTSTGFAGGGATIEDVQLLKSIAEKSGVRVKASGGIRTRDEAIAMIEAGADRIGTSSGVRIVTGD